MMPYIVVLKRGRKKRGCCLVGIVTLRKKIVLIKSIQNYFSCVTALTALSLAEESFVKVRFLEMVK